MNLSIEKILKQISDLYNERGRDYGNSYLDSRNNVPPSTDLVQALIQLKNDRIKAIDQKINNGCDTTRDVEKRLYEKRNAELIDIATYCIMELAINQDWEESQNENSGEIVRL